MNIPIPARERNDIPHFGPITKETLGCHSGGANDRTGFLNLILRESPAAFTSSPEVSETPSMAPFAGFDSQCRGMRI